MSMAYLWHINGSYCQSFESDKNGSVKKYFKFEIEPTLGQR